MYEKLQAKLGDAEMEELKALIAGANAAPLLPWQAWVMGTVKSWTVWFGGALLLLPTLWPQILPYLQDLLGPDMTKRVMQVVGILVIILRFKTSQSVVDKGATKSPAAPTSA